MRLDESLMIEKEDNLGCRLITEDSFISGWG
jgi:hypothetical protein